jgi:hypothetical protein
MGDRPVRIDGIQGYQPQRPDEQNALSRPASARTDGENKAVDSSDLLAEVRRTIRAAVEVEEVNRDAVAEAKGLLASGQLQSPEAFRRAAEAILSRGL